MTGKVLDERPPPCLGPRGRCLSYQRCREELLACRVFSYYVHQRPPMPKGRKAFVPTHAIYRRLFREGPDEYNDVYNEEDL